MKQLEWLMELGRSVKMEGNRPFMMDHQNTLFLVTAGSVDLFYTMCEEGEIIGRRRFLFTVTAGEIIFSIPPSEEGKRRFLISGQVSTGIHTVEWTAAMEAFRERNKEGRCVALLHQWMKQVHTYMDTHDLFPESGLETEPETGLETGPASLHFTEKMLNEDRLGEVLAGMYQRLHEVLFKKEEEARKADAEAIRQHATFDRWFVNSSLKQLVSITEPLSTSGNTTTFHHPMLAAAYVVAEKLGISIPASVVDLLATSPKDPMGVIAQGARFQTRLVLLRDQWYKEDNGPMVGFLEEGKHPVALLPQGPDSYDMHHVQDMTSVSVNESVAEKLLPYAYSFYRPFPFKAMNVWQLLKFGLGNSWKRDWLLLLLMGIAGGLMGTLTPVATGILFVSVIPEAQQGQLIQIGFLLVAAALANFLFLLTRSVAMLRLEGKMDGSIQAAVWDRLLSLPVPFFKDYAAGELAMRAMGITRIRREISGIAVNTVLTSLFSLFTFGLLFYYNRYLAFAAAGLVMLSMTVTLGLGYFQTRYEKQLVSLSHNIQGLVLQLLGGVAKFRVAGAENRAYHQWVKAFTQQRKLAFRNELMANSAKTFNTMFPLGTAMLIYFMAVNTPAAQMEPGSFIAFNAALITFTVYMMGFSETYISLNKIVPLYEMTKPILQTLPEYDEAKMEAGTLTGDIEVSRVSFRYREGMPLVLNDVSITIREGEYVALVGASGSGKSTLFRVLLGFEKPEKGQVYYNGKDLDKVDIRSVRKQLGVVLQNGQLMQGDIFTNIIGANPQLTINDAWEAAKMAGLEEDIKAMPMGMHTVISEGASTLSGGQRQRLMIARAIVNRPRILYFDEATSALDNQTQKIVSESLDQFRSTRIVIAHRLSTIMNCHRIIVMDKGRVVEQGSYQELMQQEGFFAQLAKRQLA